MIKKIKYFYFVLLLTGISYSQSLFNFSYDFALFKNDDNRTIIELYYGFDQSGLKFIKNEKVFEAAGQLILDIRNANTEEQVAFRNFKMDTYLQDTSGNNKVGRLLGQVNIVLDSGSYKLKLTAKDFNNVLDSVYDEQVFSLSRFSSDKVSSSSLQLATEVKKFSGGDSIFYKNTLEVIPNPIRIFGNNISKAFYYIEFYNLSELILGNEYSITWEVRDTTGATLKSSNNKYKFKNSSKVDYGYFEVKELPTGNYKMYVRLENNAGEKLIELDKSFFVYTVGSNVNNSTESADFLSSEYLKMTEKDVDQEFDYSKYIMKESVINNYEKLKDVESKRRFMYSFWKALDPNPSTPLNEGKKDYLNRIAFANKNYKSEFSEGWKTDRGRVICMYGKPDEIERHPFESETRAYEIWNYNALDGGVIFVFVDLRSDNGDYTLIHSTKRSELRNDDWQAKIKVR